MTQTQPNIIFFFTDQQRWDTCGCYGSPLELTPNLDQMADEGVRFTHAFSAQPVCGPARACIQTGVYPTETGCYRNGIRLPDGAKTLAHYYREAGYEVGYIGKWHLAETGDQPVPPERRGGYSDYWLGADLLEFTSHPYGGGYFDADGNLVEFDGYRVDSQTDHVLEYLRTRDGDKPFFLFLSYLEPHHQNDMNRYVAPDGYADNYRDALVPADLTENPEGDWPENIADYYGICKSIDENLGRVREQLDALGMADDTVIIYTTDHGSHFRTRNAEYKRTCHESAIRLPMVAVGGPFQGGRVVDEMVSLVDLPATLVDMAQGEVPDYFHGRSLLPLAAGDEVENWPEEAFIQISESQVGRAIRTRRWKYGVDAPESNGWSDMASEVYVEQYLYDLEADPYELDNLIGRPEYRTVADDLADRLVCRMVAAGEEAPEIVKK